MPRDSREPEAVTVTPDVLRELAEANFRDYMLEGVYTMSDGMEIQLRATLRSAADHIGELEREVAVRDRALANEMRIPETAPRITHALDAARAALAAEAEKEDTDHRQS